MLDEVDGPALKAWQIFQDQMQRLYGRCPPRGTYFHDRYRSTYRRIAEMCQKHGVDVDDFMLKGFELLTKAKNQYITPKDFVVKEKVMGAYLLYQQRYGNDAAASWIQQENKMIGIICRLVPDTYPCEEAVLLDPDIPCASWYRALYPHVCSDRVFKAYGELAWSTLRINRKLRSVAERMSPANLKELERRWGHLGNPAAEGAQT